MAKGLALVAVVSMGVACGDGTGSSLRARLQNRGFVSESVEGRTLVAGTRLSISFTDTGVSAVGGCNSFFADFELRGDTLVIGTLGQTGLGCLQPGVMEQEGWYVTLLGSGPTLALDEPRLVMTAPGTKVTFLDRKIVFPDKPLVGTSWVGDGTSNGMVTTVETGSENVTLLLGSDGKIAVDTSCQKGAGAFTSDATSISFGGITYDGAACATATFQRTSDAVRGVLDGSRVTYKISESALTVTSADGHALLFRAAP
jgi:heat shock protein HslJ